jgi:hypothetical protein
LSSVQKRSYQLQPGDLLRLKDGSGIVGLILGPGYISITKELQTVQVLWSDEDEPSEIDVIAYEKGWVELVSRADVPTVLI